MQSSDSILIGQKKYALDVLRRFRMEDSNALLSPIVFKVSKDEIEIQVDATLQTNCGEFNVLNQHKTRLDTRSMFGKKIHGTTN